MRRITTIVLLCALLCPLAWGAIDSLNAINGTGGRARHWSRRCA